MEEAEKGLCRGQESLESPSVAKHQAFVIVCFRGRGEY